MTVANSVANPRRIVRIGAGAGYAGDRLEPAVELVEHGALDYLVFECLDERTVALAQHARIDEADTGFDPRLEARMRAVLPIAARKGVRIITNMGAANPLEAAYETAHIARELGLDSLSIAAVTGDDVLEIVKRGTFRFQESGEPVSAYADRLVSANAYLGAGAIVAALEAEADVVITGRIADASLFAAPLIHEFKWRFDDWNALGQATVIGHLLECAGQLAGGSLADPGVNDVPNLARLGFPIGEVSSDGGVTITKLANTGGYVTETTCAERLLRDVDELKRYVQPDVIADFSGVKLAEQARNRVRVTGGRGMPAPSTFKVTVGYRDGFIGEGQIAYSGPNAIARGRLALDIVRERLDLAQVKTSDVRFDLIGVDVLSDTTGGERNADAYEVRARVTGRAATREDAMRIAGEVETLRANGPAGGGGVSTEVREVIAVQSVLVPQDGIDPWYQLVEV